MYAIELQYDEIEGSISETAEGQLALLLASGMTGAGVIKDWIHILTDAYQKALYIHAGEMERARWALDPSAWKAPTLATALGVILKQGDLVGFCQDDFIYCYCVGLEADLAGSLWDDWCAMTDAARHGEPNPIPPERCGERFNYQLILDHTRARQGGTFLRRDYRQPRTSAVEIAATEAANTLPF